MRQSAQIAQDVYRRLADPCAMAGLLRLRTSPEFRVVNAYGHLFPDERFENLCHVIACSPSSAFAFDFDYTGPAGFSSESNTPPMLQMAFQYTVAVPWDLAAEKSGIGRRQACANGLQPGQPPQARSVPINCEAIFFPIIQLLKVAIQQLHYHGAFMS